MRRFADENVGDVRHVAVDPLQQLTAGVGRNHLGHDFPVAVPERVELLPIAAIAS